jgi:hypothetical protein
MTLVRKLKPDRSIGGAIVPISLPIIFALTAVIFEFSTALKVGAALMLLFGLFYIYMLLRTGNLHLLAIVLEAIFFAFMFWLLSEQYTFGKWDQQAVYQVAFLTGVITFGILLIFFGMNRRLQWRGREIFELVGRVEYSLHELRGFARFAAKHMMALPYISNKNITLVPLTMGDEFFRLLGLLGDYRDATWINFDVDGEVSIHIAQKDYLEYREPLAFDNLCQSFGQLFIDFLDLYCKGEGIRAVGRMDDLKIPFFS